MVFWPSELLESLAKRPHVYAHPASFVTIQIYLRGLKAGCQLIGIEYSWDDYQAAAEARGWDPCGNLGILRDFTSKGLSDEDMVRELIAVEADAYSRAQARANEPSRSGPAGEIAMNVQNTLPQGRRWTASELRKLPPAERDAILETAAARAESEYRHDSQLTAFEAFGKDDLYGDSSSSETR